MTPRHRFLIRIVLPAALIVFLAAAYSFYWWQVAQRLNAGISAWTAEQRAAGATVDYSWNGIGGFPFAFTADFDDVSLLGSWAGTAISVRTAHLRLTMSPVDLTAIRLISDKPLTTIIPGLILDSSAAEGTRLIADQADGQIDLQNGQLARLRIDAGRSKVDNGKAIISAGSMHLGIAFPETPPRDFKDMAAEIHIGASNVDLPAGQPQLLPGPILQIGLAGTIKGPILPPQAGDAARPITNILARWRDSGGVLDVSRFDFSQGPLSLTGAGTFAFDQNLQPLGASKVTAVGLGDLIDLMTARGQIAGKEAETAKIVVAGLEKPGASGRPEVTLGLTIQDNIVSFGPLKLARLTPIPWPKQ